MILSENELRDLAAYYVVANTPLYLYRRFRSHPAVQRLAREERPLDLLLEFRRDSVEAGAAPSLAQGTYLYALLVAMSMQEYTVAQELLARAGQARLEWHEAITQIARATGTPETEVVIKPSPFGRPIDALHSLIDREASSTQTNPFRVDGS